MNTLKYFRNKFSLSHIDDSIAFKRKFAKEHPEYFDPDGILVFCGPQGSGKTLSAVSYVLKLMEKYPECILVSNVDIHAPVLAGRKVYRYYDWRDLGRYSNGYGGVIFLIDEIQIEFNSLESKQVDPALFTEIAQQRKQRKHIVGTSQVFNRIAKPFREQFKLVCLCKCFFGLIQFNKVVKGEDCAVDDDGRISTERVRRYFWTHSPALYDSYDTYAKIERPKWNDNVKEYRYVK